MKNNNIKTVTIENPSEALLDLCRGMEKHKEERKSNITFKNKKDFKDLGVEMIPYYVKDGNLYKGVTVSYDISSSFIEKIKTEMKGSLISISNGRTVSGVFADLKDTKEYIPYFYGVKVLIPVSDNYFYLCEGAFKDGIKYWRVLETIEMRY